MLVTPFEAADCSLEAFLSSADNLVGQYRTSESHLQSGLSLAGLMQLACTLKNAEVGCVGSNVSSHFPQQKVFSSGVDDAQVLLTKLMSRDVRYRGITCHPLFSTSPAFHRDYLSTLSEPAICVTCGLLTLSRNMQLSCHRLLMKNQHLVLNARATHTC